MNIYVGNLKFELTEEDIRPLFEKHGRVNSVKMISDRETGRPKGFGFVEMPDDDEANKAIADLNGFAVEGRQMVVNEARPRTNQGGGGGSRGGHGWSGGGGHGGYGGGRGGRDRDR